MAKLTLTDLANLNNETSAVNTINTNNDSVETAIENTLSRDGTSPNTMSADLDMNSNQILNLPAPSADTDVVRKTELDSAVADIEAGIVTDGSVTNAKLEDVSQNTIKGRISSGTGSPEDLTATQVRTIINVEDGSEANDSAAEILTKVLTVDGSGSGLDADLLRGTTPTAFALTFLDDANAAAVRTTLGLVIGTDVQAYDDDISDIAALTPTKGNIMVGDGTDWVAVGVGTDGQLLTADSGEVSGVIWAGTTVSAPSNAEYILSTADPVLTAERVATDSSTVAWDRGTAGQMKLYVIDNSVTPAKMEHGTQGDVLYYGAAGAPGRLGAGTDGQVLQSQGSGADPIWTGPLVATIASGTLSAASTLDVALDGDTWDEVTVIIDDLNPSTNSTLEALFSQSAAFLTGASDYAQAYIYFNPGVTGTNDSTAASMLIVGDYETSASGRHGSFRFTIYRPNTSSVRKWMEWSGYHPDDSNNIMGYSAGFGCLMANTNAIEDVRFQFQSGTMTGNYIAIGKKYG